MKTLYIHIGIHKTATTYIQEFCAENRDLLHSKGVLYPPSPFPYWYKNPTKNGMFLGRKCFDGNWVRHPEAEEKQFTEGLQYIADLFEKDDTILFSQESLWRDFYRNDCNNLKRLKVHSETNGYRIRMIVYLRRQDQFIEAWWNQIIKMDFRKTLDFTEYLNTYQSLDYYSILKAYEDILGADALCVRRFDDAVRGEGIISDFMNCFGLDLTDEYTISSNGANLRLSGNTITIKKVINSLEDLTREDNFFLTKVLTSPAVPAGKVYPCSEMTEEERTALMKKYDEGNQLIADRYICDGRPLFSHDYSCKPKRTVDNPEYINDIIRTTFYANIELNRELIRLKDRIASLEKQNSHMRHPFKWLLSKIKRRFR